MADHDADGMVYWNDGFHRLMGEMADNLYLRPSYERLLIDHARISQIFYRPRNPEMTRRLQQSVAHHEQMIEYLGRHDAERLVAIIAEHWALSRDRVDGRVPLMVGTGAMRTEDSIQYAEAAAKIGAVHLPMKGAQGRFQAARSGKTFDTLETPSLARP